MFEIHSTRCIYALPTSPCDLGVDLGRLLKCRLLAQAPAADFIESDWTSWMTPAVTAHMSAHGRWMDVATLVRHEVGEPLRCHFTVLDRWCSRQGSRAYFGFGLYPYRGRSYWWLHSWLIDASGTLIDSAERDEQTRLSLGQLLYFGVPWSWALLDAVNATPGHEFEDILADGLRRCRALPQLQPATPSRLPVSSPTA